MKCYSSREFSKNMLDEDNKTILCNRIINILAKKGFDKIEEPRNLRLREQLDIKESFNIVLEFLKKFDINLYNMFLNLVEHDKESFLFLNEDINEDIKEFAYGCVKEDGKLIIIVKNNIRDVFTIVHEFIHKVYFQKHISSKINFNNFVEVSSITIELYLYKYLMDYTEYELDAEKVMKERYFYETLTGFYICYVNFIKEIFKEDPWEAINIDNYEDIFNKEIQLLPVLYKNTFIKYHKYFDGLIKEDGTDLENKLNFRFRYVNGLYLASYIFYYDNRELFDKMGLAAYDDTITFDLDYLEADECFYNYFNKFVNKINNISRIR